MISSASGCLAISKLSETVSGNKRKVEHTPLSLLAAEKRRGGEVAYSPGRVSSFQERTGICLLLKTQSKSASQPPFL